MEDVPADPSEDEEGELEADDDEFDPFADSEVDPPPDDEGDDRVIEESE